MTTVIVSPDFLDVDGWRQVQRNNEPVRNIPFTVWTDETWLPLVLSSAGFFPSNGEVKKNRPDFWRDVVPGETVTIGKWATIKVVS